jgi:Fe-Mn family superoxide dismutase
LLHLPTGHSFLTRFNVKLEMPALPYAKEALEPTMSALTVEIHYEKHHRGYVDKVRELIEGTQRESLELEQLVVQSEGELFNNAAQAWNHAFFWRSMRPEGGDRPAGRLLEFLELGFGSLDRFRKEFADAAIRQFGSGWTWLVQDSSGELRVSSTSDADNPLMHGATPLLTLDVWEHAYYLDYRNDRARYVDGFLDRLVNWEFAAENLESAAAMRPRQSSARRR